MSTSTRVSHGLNLYSALLEKIVPRLERTLSDRLQRLEATVTQAESERSLSPVRRNRPKRIAGGAAKLGPPATLALYAQLHGTRRHCRGLIERAGASLRAALAG